MEESNLSLEELEKMEEVKLEIDEEAFKVDKGNCPNCQKKMDKFIENKNLFDGSMTFHIIKFKCGGCKKEYLDLDQAETYDLFLTLNKISQKKPLEFLNTCLGKVAVSA